MPVLPTRVVDCHTHTDFSDAHATMEENLAAAEKVGCTLLVSTDHLTVPEWFAPEIKFAIPEHRLAAHADKIAELQADGAKRGVEVVYGFECDWYEGCEENIERWRGDATFLLGSVHFLDQHPVDPSGASEIWDGQTIDEVWERYVDAWCRACFSSAGFDSMAHPDLVRLLEAQTEPHAIDLAPLHARMAEAAHEAGVHVEVSTGGMRKPVLGSMYPSAELIRAFHAAEVPITIASDSHRACDVAYGFADACAYAREAGYRTFDAPRQRGGWSTYEL